MLTGEHITRKVTIAASVFLILAQLVPTIAIACEGPTVSEQKNTGKGPCVEMKVGDECNLFFETGLIEREIEKGEVVGGEALYKKEIEGCKKGLVLIATESCKDVVKTIKEKAGDKTEYCWLYTNMPKMAEKLLQCEVMTM